MASKKIYYNEESVEITFQAYRNADGNLFVCIDVDDLHENSWVVLPSEDAKEIITELARQFDMLDEDSVEGNILFKI